MIGAVPSDVRFAVLLAAGLAFVAGFVDTCGFVALFGLFTAHVTGNFVVIGASLVEPRSGLVTKLLALPVFVMVVAITHLVMTSRTKAGRANHHFALIAQALLLAMFCGVGLMASPIVHGDQPLAMLAGLLGVAAMAVQNAAGRAPFHNFTPTTVMTGNTTQLVMDAVDCFTGKAQPEIWGRFRKTWPVVLAFAAGAVAGALGFGLLGFWCLLIPVAILLSVSAGLARPVGLL
jgi:uncharacterized membrane protein YoaK (UPF0700 family)